jgi:hypothetical protein
MGSLRSLNKEKNEKKRDIKKLNVDLHTDASLEVKDALDLSIFRSIAFIDLITISFDSTSPTVGYVTLYQHIVTTPDSSTFIPAVSQMHKNQRYTKILTLKIRSRVSLVSRKIDSFISFLREEMNYNPAISALKRSRNGARTTTRYYGIT